MSTTFGIKIPVLNDKDEIVEVAFRTFSIQWKNPLAKLLPDNTKVIPLDNTAQGIYTIGDIKKSINNSLSSSTYENSKNK